MIEDLTRKAQAAQGKKEIQDLVKSIGSFLTTDPSNSDLLLIRAELYIKLQLFGQAINDFENVLVQKPDDKSITIRIEQLKTILKYNNTDIYASPNTHFDPWLD